MHSTSICNNCQILRSLGWGYLQAARNILGTLDGLHLHQDEKQFHLGLSHEDLALTIGEVREGHGRCRLRERGEVMNHALCNHPYHFSDRFRTRASMTLLMCPRAHDIRRMTASRIIFVAEPNRMPCEGILFHIISSARREDTVAAGKRAAADNKAGRT